MFSRSKINDPIEVNKKSGSSSQSKKEQPSFTEPQKNTLKLSSAAASSAKVPPSILSSDLTIIGDISTPGDMQIEGVVEGNVASQLLTVGETATIRGEVVADDILVNGRIVGTIRASKVRLSATAYVEGDIVHGTIAIEAGGRFEGSVTRSDDPLNKKKAKSGETTTKTPPKIMPAGNSVPAPAKSQS